jgi:fucose 4-O-acetylase-like acetyltransferase
LDLTLRSPHGGLFGSLGWSAMMILGTALADLFLGGDRAGKLFPWISLAILAAGIALALFSPVSKHRVSAPYILISLGISALLFLLFHWASDIRNWNSRLLLAWGKNPLVLYFLHYLLIGIFFLPGIPSLYTTAPLWMVLLEMVFLLVVISMVALWMDRKKIIIAL